MRFQKYCVKKTRVEDQVHTPQRVAAAKRAVQRDLDRNALCPELVRFSDPEERLDAYDRRCVDISTTMRRWRYEHWIKARWLLRIIPARQREGILKLWNRGYLPGDPVYLLDMINGVLTGQFDPHEKWQRMEDIAEQGRKSREKQNQLKEKERAEHE